jgi:hypothetical protein
LICCNEFCFFWQVIFQHCLGTGNPQAINMTSHLNHWTYNRGNSIKTSKINLIITLIQLLLCLNLLLIKVIPKFML